jgi:hypothetical protein
MGPALLDGPALLLGRVRVILSRVKRFFRSRTITRLHSWLSSFSISSRMFSPFPSLFGPKEFLHEDPLFGVCLEKMSLHDFSIIMIEI